MISKYEIDGLKVYKYILDAILSNMYILIRNSVAYIVDPHISREADDLLQQEEVNKVWIILTHEHYDHISGVNHLKERYECVVVGSVGAQKNVPNPLRNMSACFMAMMTNRDEDTVHKARELLDEDYGCQVDIAFEKEHLLETEGLSFQLVETPGHSQGSICIIVNDAYIFTGDSLVDGNPIITKLPGGSRKDYQRITKPFLERLAKDMIVFPGHGMEGRLCDFEIV